MSRVNHISWRVSQVTSAVWSIPSVFTVNSGTSTAKLYLFLLVLLSSIFVGCIDNPVQSLTPFYTEDAVIQLPQLEGEWLSFFVFDDDILQMNIKPWVLEGSTVKIFDENGKISVAQTKFFQIEDSYFADIVMANFSLEFFDDFNGDTLASDVNLLANFAFTFWSMSHWRPVHVVYKVQIEEDHTSLVLTPLSFNWLAKILEENPDLIPLIERSDADSPFASPSANATSETWMLLLKKYRNEEKAFPSDQMFNVLLKKYGKAHVLQSYENGNPQVAVFPEDREFADGAQAKANTPISYAENGQIVGFTLNRDWQSPNGLWARAGSWLAYFEENARIESCTLDRDWQSPAGLWLKDGTRVEYFENGQLSRATLAKDWKSPKGKLIKAGTELKFSKDGKVKKSSSE